MGNTYIMYMYIWYSVPSFRVGGFGGTAQFGASMAEPSLEPWCGGSNGGALPPWRRAPCTPETVRDMALEAKKWPVACGLACQQESPLEFPGSLAPGFFTIDFPFIPPLILDLSVFNYRNPLQKKIPALWWSVTFPSFCLFGYHLRWLI